MSVNGTLSALQSLKRHVKEPIAVVGMACRLPGNSNSPHALWEFLERGGIADNTPPESRFRLEAHYDGSDKPKTMRSPGGMFLESVDVKQFDAAFFGIAKADAIAMDPQQRQLLEVVYECLENAGVTLGKLDGEAVGCFVGAYAVDYADVQGRDPEDRVASIAIGAGRAMLSNRISHFLNIHGPSMTIDTACSGSLVSLDIACRYLSNGEMTGALVAGASLYFSPDHNEEEGAMRGAYSPSGRCHTLDKKADGYIKAEGVNCVMLKRLSDAQRDGDSIRAIIRGTATNHDGLTPGIASPNWQAQADVTRAAYANAGIDDLSATGYIEMHGTGTRAGDPEEVKGVASVFAPSRPHDAPLVIGSIKSNVGHSEPAAGISGLIKAILAIEKGRIPGNPTFVDPNPEIDFNASRVRASRYTIPWPAPSGGLRRASVNSFGFGGSNAHAIVDQVPEEMQNYTSSFASASDDLLEEPEAVTRPHVLVFSANDSGSVKSYAKSLRKHLLDPRVRVDLPTLANTLSERRTLHFHRGYLVTDDLKLDVESIAYGKKSPEPPRIGFIFSGQGAQWSQMGRSLIDNFPEARATVERLDTVLQGLLHPPSWSLLDELYEARSPEKLRRPELSQPLVTALQIAILSVFRTWGVTAGSVVGHSSGEIAAAYAAGLLSEDNAIKAAYYRGYAAVRRAQPRKKEMGMMAVGLGEREVREYVSKAALDEPSGGQAVVTVACYNSPGSVTLSGTRVDLEALRQVFVADKVSARMLQVDMAYHSPFMAATGDEYARCLKADAFSILQPHDDKTKMFSSVDGHYKTSRLVDVDYWYSNLMQPVLYHQALHNMLSQEECAPDFLIEIGPSDILASPTIQVKKQLPDGGSGVQYCAAMKRGQGAERAIFDVGGRLFLAGQAIDLTVVNGTQDAQRKLLTDLPNYCWNHEVAYWHESEASTDWRNKQFAHHDLLGSKLLGSAWQAPVFKKKLSLDDLPWLRDHRIGRDILFPAAGFICMAAEAMMQTDAMLRPESELEPKHDQQVRLRNVSFNRALILEEGKGTKILLTLTPHMGQNGSWYHWAVRSRVEASWVDHCTGQVRIVNDPAHVAKKPSDISPLQHPTPGSLWYKALSDVGYDYGKSFRKMMIVETTSGSRESRAVVDVLAPPSRYAQSHYPIHPAALDGCMQCALTGMWRGIRSSVSSVLVPCMIDDILLSRKGRGDEDRVIAVTKSVFVGPGRTDLAVNYSPNLELYHPETGDLILRITGLSYRALDSQDTPYSAHRCSRLVWKPDVTLSPQACAAGDSRGWNKVQDIADLIAHKKPNAKVVEASLVPQDSASVWLEGISAESKARNAFVSYSFLSSDVEAVAAAQDKYEVIPRTAFQLSDISKPTTTTDVPGKSPQSTDLVILRLPALREAETIQRVLENVRRMLRADGHVLVLEQRGVWDAAADDAPTSGGGPVMNGGSCACDGILEANGFSKLYTLDCLESLSLCRAHLATTTTTPTATGAPLDVLHLAEPGALSKKIVKALADLGWDVREQYMGQPLAQIRAESTVVVLTEVETRLLPSPGAEQWTVYKELLQMRSNRIVWLSRSAQLTVANPDGAIIYGLCRSIRMEDPSMSITILDLEDPDNDAGIPCIDLLLRSIRGQASTGGKDVEYLERGGVLHVSRVLADDGINAAARGHASVKMRLHEADGTVRMIADRVGSLDSLLYAQVDPEPLPLADNTVEVELFASALNFKDVAVAMGIVPENELLLGGEGAGTIRRVGANLNAHFDVGQRVLVFGKGTFANRIITTTERTVAIPDWLSYEDAATLPSVYLTALYSLDNLSDVKRGDRVLIHSATGGLGIASIHVCRAMGAEVYATVGQDAKRRFLTERFAIPEDHIFNSRNANFERQIMEMTDGLGVDIILNTLTGDLLDASWRCIADGGTMVELGKKDHIDRNKLAMEPFARNASYRCFDMSHKHVTDTVIADLMKKMMKMLVSGTIEPIAPVTLFPYNDIPSAFRYLRSANHIGKVVISNKELDSPDPVVAVRPVPRKLRLRSHVSYLIVGGLRGLCGSLAVEMARLGARNVVVMGRSGFDDAQSQIVLKDLSAEGCHADLVRGDVSCLEDVRRAFNKATKPVGGIVQGAVVLRDRPFEGMSYDEYCAVISPKVAGTWNLHNVALEMRRELDFFTMLSSISGLIGHLGQANYAAGSTFLDSFAYYRRGLGLKANSVNLGPIQEVGCLSRHDGLLTSLYKAAWTPFNEALFLKVVGISILQQEEEPVNAASCAQLITSIAVPQPPSSALLPRDTRFSSLLFGEGAVPDAARDAGQDPGNRQMQALLVTIRSGAADASSAKTIKDAVADVVNRQFVSTLGLDEPLEPTKPMSSYGVDSLTAVEFRNWCRAQLAVDLSTMGG
ncbi:hypothetical protein L249_1549 [Ophiocordyceps polyrhachis-furcata BCC 54312]|uniref:Uncharacterized protein n=1 Tax=Ophiocordyceps polyrhachis-furcata BCC 54312 TaxID=1330021 RepID=A0A367L3Y8_9HYPO|nr:hypothetical protein L249_1549 [Ophiocordyceps polyrhachis-furcata BCC 54312]